MWYQSKISYRVQDAAGKWKTITESFLHDGVSFTDVEAQVFSMIEGRITDFELKAIAQVRFENVYMPHVGGDFYKVTVLIEDKADDKKTVTAHLVAAEDVADAEERAEDYMKTWQQDTTITGVVKSPILGVWHPHNQQWKDDFLERMQALKEAGNESKAKNDDPAQTIIFDKDGKPKRYDEPKAEEESTDVDLDQFAEATAKYEASQKPAWKRAEEARDNDDTPWADVDSRSDNLTPFSPPSQPTAEQISDVAAMRQLEQMEEADDLDTIGDGSEPTTTGQKRKINFFTPDKPARKTKA